MSTHNPNCNGENCDYPALAEAMEQLGSNWEAERVYNGSLSVIEPVKRAFHHCSDCDQDFPNVADFVDHECQPFVVTDGTGKKMLVSSERKCLRFARQNPQAHLVSRYWDQDGAPVFERPGARTRLRRIE